MPAPSPARGSAPTAPRCSRLTRMVSASSTILCDLRPLISAINPTPQESFSSAGSNRPKPDALIVVLALPAGTRIPCSGAGAIHPAQVRIALRARAINSFWRQPSCRSKACGCFFAAVRRALALPAADPRAPPPAFPKRGEKGGMAARNAGHQLGQQCCPMPNMANSRRQHKGGALGSATKRSSTHRSGANSWPRSALRVDHGLSRSAMVDRGSAVSVDVEHDCSGDGLTGILCLQVVFAERQARNRNVSRTAARAALRGSLLSGDLVDEYGVGACRHIRVGHADALRIVADVVEGGHRGVSSVTISVLRRMPSVVVL